MDKQQVIKAAEILSTIDNIKGFLEWEGRRALDENGERLNPATVNISWVYTAQYDRFPGGALVVPEEIIVVALEDHIYDLKNELVALGYEGEI
jgi:hypothetical protein